TSPIKRKNFVRDMGNRVKLKAEISPCVFREPSYPLQIRVSLHRFGGERLGDAYALDHTKTAANYTKAGVEQLLAAVRIQRCVHCAKPAFDPTTVQTNRGGLCEPCFLAKLKEEYAGSLEAERQQLAAADHRMKQSGMKVRVTAWIHPEAGDDYQI